MLPAHPLLALLLPAHLQQQSQKPEPAYTDSLSEQSGRAHAALDGGRRKGQSFSIFIILVCKLCSPLIRGQVLYLTMALVPSSESLGHQSELPTSASFSHGNRCRCVQKKP